MNIVNNKEKYIEFCKKEKNIPIFSQYWWLDAVCGKNNWDVLLFEKGGEIWASMPFFKTKKYIFNIITMPKLTQTMGPYIKYPINQKYYKKLSWEKNIMTYFIENLPKISLFYQHFNYKINNHLPFYWKGFKQTTRYTYIIEDISLEELENNFETDIRRRRRKAINQGIEVFEGNNINEFYKLNKLTFKRQNKKIPYSLEFINNLYEKCLKYNSVKLFFAKDNEGNIIAANFLVYDNNTVYYLMGGIDPNKKDLGAMDLVLYESIKFALNNNKKFDFEGSMVESIEKYFRSFGAIQKPYFAIYKANSTFIKCLLNFYI